MSRVFVLDPFQPQECVVPVHPLHPVSWTGTPRLFEMPSYVPSYLRPAYRRTYVVDDEPPRRNYGWSDDDDEDDVMMQRMPSSWTRVVNDEPRHVDLSMPSYWSRPVPPKPVQARPLAPWEYAMSPKEDDSATQYMCQYQSPPLQTGPSSSRGSKPSRRYPSSEVQPNVQPVSTVESLIPSVPHRRMRTNPRDKVHGRKQATKAGTEYGQQQGSPSSSSQGHVSSMQSPFVHTGSGATPTKRVRIPVTNRGQPSQDDNVRVQRDSAKPRQSAWQAQQRSYPQASCARTQQSDSNVSSPKSGTQQKLPACQLSTTEAATKIQAVWRGYRLRKERAVVKELCNAASQLRFADQKVEQYLAANHSLYLLERQIMEVSELLMRSVLTLDGVTCKVPELKAIKKRLTTAALKKLDEVQQLQRQVSLRRESLSLQQAMDDAAVLFTQSQASGSEDTDSLKSEVSMELKDKKQAEKASANYKQLSPTPCSEYDAGMALSMSRDGQGEQAVTGAVSGEEDGPAASQADRRLESQRSSVSLTKSEQDAWDMLDQASDRGSSAVDSVGVATSTCASHADAHGSTHASDSDREDKAVECSMDAPKVMVDAGVQVNL